MKIFLLSTIVENCKTQVLGMLILMDADSLTCVCEILGLDIPERKKGTLQFLLKYILRQFNSENVEG